MLFTALKYKDTARLKVKARKRLYQPIISQKRTKHKYSTVYVEHKKLWLGTKCHYKKILSHLQDKKYI